MVSCVETSSCEEPEVSRYSCEEPEESRSSCEEGMEKQIKMEAKIFLSSKITLMYQGIHLSE